MSTQQIAERLVELCRIPDYETAQKELFADDAVSIEPYASPEFEKETKGIQAILEKGKKFESMTEEMHNTQVSEPLVAGNSFCIVLNMDITMKGKGRMAMKEICLYQVKDGKIVSESFYV
jgi:ketosteroid isomerase-like protein